LTGGPIWVVHLLLLKSSVVECLILSSAGIGTTLRTGIILILAPFFLDIW